MAFVQVEIGHKQVGNFRDTQATAQHKDEHGPVVGMIDSGEEQTQVVFLHRTGQALRLAEEVTMGQHRTDQGRVFVGQESVQREDGCQAAIDGGGLEPFGSLQADEAVDIAKGDGVGCAIPHQVGELPQVVGVVLPGARPGITAAYPVDELLDLG